MPKFLENKLRAQVPAGVDPDRYVYGGMNTAGAMHGSKETAKGREMEAKHEAKMEKAPFHHTMITHHDDGSHTVEHHPHMKPAGKSGAFMDRGEPKSYSVENGESLMGKLHEHLGLGENPEEEMEEEETKA